MYQRQLNFGEAVQRAVTVNYCNFQGRASRSEYWWFFLFCFIVGAVISGLFFWSETAETIVRGIFSLALILPSLGLAVRRMHDTGRSGWWILINLIPFIGALIFIYFAVQPSQPVPNQWGGVPNLVQQ